jgi:hypothetical protein
MEAYSPPDGKPPMAVKKTSTRTRNTKVYKNPYTGNPRKEPYRRSTKSPTREATKPGPRTAEQLAEDVKHRGLLNRQNRQEELRSKFKVDEYIRQLKTADERLEAIAKECSENKRMTKDQWNYYDSMVKIIKEQKDINFKRLAKVVGDVKAIELTDGDGKNPFTAFVGLFQQAMTEENQ